MSIILASVGLATPEAFTASLHNTSFPAVPDILVVPVAFDEGNATPFVPPEANWIRKYPFAGIVPLNVVLLLPHEIPVADVYWIDQDVIVTGDEELLYNSTKSFRNGAPALPPPP